MRTKGFTLIELLVVIAIIAILAAILFPVFARAREKARQNSCLSNVKQLTLGIMMYANDYDEYMPPVLAAWVVLPSWRTCIYPYVKNLQIFQCPSRPNAGISAYPAVEYPPGSSTGFPRSYGVISDAGYTGTPPTGLNSDFPQWWGGPQCMASMPKPAETLILAETWADYFPYAGQGAAGACTNIAASHSGVGNYGFVDGHAKAMTPGATIIGQNMWTIQDDDPTVDSHGLLTGMIDAAPACPSNQ